MVKLPKKKSDGIFGRNLGGLGTIFKQILGGTFRGFLNAVSGETIVGMLAVIFRTIFGGISGGTIVQTSGRANF